MIRTMMLKQLHTNLIINLHSKH